MLHPEPTLHVVQNAQQSEKYVKKQRIKMFWRSECQDESTCESVFGRDRVWYSVGIYLGLLKRVLAHEFKALTGAVVSAWCTTEPLLDKGNRDEL